MDILEESDERREDTAASKMVAFCPTATTTLKAREMAATTDSKPKATVFYSWQSDLPNATNRGLIQDALERAVKRIRDDISLAVDPVLDRDTQNVPGAPDIAHTIFQKIEKAIAFVADVSIINPGLGRPTPNPNVLIEVGYALKTLGSPRTVLIANTANGPIEALPFDLRTKRVLTYYLPRGTADKSDQRKKVQEGLEFALRAIFADTVMQPVPPSSAVKAIESIQKSATNQASVCAKVTIAIAKRVEELTPKLRREVRDRWDDFLVEAIQQTLPLVTDFARVADEAAAHDSHEAALGLFRGFASLFSQYNLPPGFSGEFFDVHFDLPKFIGHELIVTLFSAMIGERRWGLIADLCRETVMIPNAGHRFHTETPVTYIYASEYLRLLEHRNERLKLKRLSLHADILKARHEAGDLRELSPWQRFQDADVFLYLRSIFEQPQEDLWSIWRPWSVAVLDRCPAFLLEATKREKAEQLMEALGAKDLVDLRRRLKEAIERLYKLFGSRNPFFYPFANLNPDLIGTK
jgi:hypothetical protein